MKRLTYEDLYRIIHGQPLGRGASLLIGLEELRWDLWHEQDGPFRAKVGNWSRDRIVATLAMIHWCVAELAEIDGDVERAVMFRTSSAELEMLLPATG